ncbi:MAG TPA: hypothetical protein PK051_08745, partial [Trichococcus flocculiformis]|nr:hypothetical protein [Trichococcus flocculiformis]
KNYLAFILMEFAILGMVLLTVLRHSRGLLIVAMCVLALLPLVKLGPSNDLLLRVATPSLVLMAILCQRAVLDAWTGARPRAMVIVVMLLIGAIVHFALMNGKSVLYFGLVVTPELILAAVSAFILIVLVRGKVPSKQI